MQPAMSADDGREADCTADQPATASGDTSDSALRLCLFNISNIGHLHEYETLTDEWSMRDQRAMLNACQCALCQRVALMALMGLCEADEERSKRRKKEVKIKNKKKKERKKKKKIALAPSSRRVSNKKFMLMSISWHAVLVKCCLLLFG